MGEANKQDSSTILKELSSTQRTRLVHGTLAGVKRFFEEPGRWDEYTAWHIQKYGYPPTTGYGCPEAMKASRTYQQK